MFWFTIVLVVILGFCLAPKVVRSTPPSPGAVELYKREHASGVVVSGLEITFPSDYGYDIYSDGSRIEKELYNVRVRILQGPEKTVLKTLSPQRPNQLPPGNFEPIDIEPTEWYKRSQQGKRVVLLLETFNYTDDKELAVEVGFRNSLTGEYVTTEKSFDAPAHSTAFDVLENTFLNPSPEDHMAGINYLEYITGGTLEECSKRCRELPECAAFYRKENGECALHRMGASGATRSWFTETSYVKRRIARATPIGTIVPV